jgi:very-short-patch-repair endonuclease
MNKKKQYTRFNLPYNPKLTQLAKQLRKQQTPAEIKLWHKFFRLVSPRVYRQRPIDEYIVDFYCHELQLVVEIDGDTHYSEATKRKDEFRSDRLKEFGLKVIRFTNMEINESFNGVCETLLSRGFEWKE